MHHKSFNYSSPEELLADIAQLESGLPFSADIRALREPVRIGGCTIGNRVMVHPMEGVDSELDGSPSERTAQRYRRFARGGAGSVWMESVSVNRRGRTSPHQLWITKENQPAFAKLAQAIADAAASPVYTVLQLTHSGRFSNPDGTPAPLCAFHNPYIPKESETMITDEELEALEDDYVRCARSGKRSRFLRR